MKLGLIAALASLSFAAVAQAQDGFYFGVGVGATKSSTVAPIVSFYDAQATDTSLALTAGYRFAGDGLFTMGIEGNLDVLTGKTMNDGTDACTGTSPSWCEVNSVVRLRATLTHDLANGSRLVSSAGVAVARGVTENGPGNNLDTVGRGLSFGLGWEQVGSLPVRVDVNYDAIKHDNQQAFDRKLDLVGLRVSYMF